MSKKNANIMEIIEDANLAVLIIVNVSGLILTHSSFRILWQKGQKLKNAAKSNTLYYFTLGMDKDNKQSFQSHG